MNEEPLLLGKLPLEFEGNVNENVVAGCLHRMVSYVNKSWCCEGG